jgi:hypothetical protein
MNNNNVCEGFAALLILCAAAFGIISCWDGGQVVPAINSVSAAVLALTYAVLSKK